MNLSHISTQKMIKYLSIPLIINMVIAGCTTPGIDQTPIKDVPSTPHPLSTDKSVDEMIAGLSPAAAISTLDSMASASNPETAFTLLIKAAEIAIPHESPQAINERLQSLYRRYPDQNKSVQLAILNSRILIARKEPSQAIKILDNQLQQATPHEKLSIYSLKAEALHQTGLFIKSVQLRILLDKDYQKHDPTKQINNDQQLWNSLMQAHPDLISRHISEVPDILSGWLELAYITHHQLNSTSLNNKIDKWITRNSNHPANRYIVQHMKKKQVATSAHPKHIAIVLPLSGKFAPVGKAVRDGFMSAYLESNRIFGTQSTIDIYDTRSNAAQAAQTVRLASDRGAQFIIGPLHRNAVSAAIEAIKRPVPITAISLSKNTKESPLPVPAQRVNMLTLNKAPNKTLTNLELKSGTPISGNRPTTIYQFDLTPETEAIQVAERINREGLTYAMVMVPENTWGNRIYEAFTKRHQELSGKVIAVSRFKKNTSDFSNDIQQGLKLNHSKTRHKQLQLLLHEDLEFTPRRRQDIDVIFIAASPDEARQIKPQLEFFYANKIPVYATSSIYSGNINVGQNKDLENIKFCDMPWVLTEKPESGSLHETILSTWHQESKKYLRFYALGSDAFLILPQLKWLMDNPNDSITGGTGRLSVDKTGTVKRQLTWANFKRTVPKLEQILPD